MHASHGPDIKIKNMRTILLLLLLFSCSTGALMSQNLKASKPAHLQIFGKTVDGDEFIIESTELRVIVEQKLMKGHLNILTLRTSDPDIAVYLTGVELEELLFNVKIPEGVFRYGESTEKEISQEGEIICGGHKAPFLMNMTVTHRKTSDRDIFFVVGTGDLMIDQHLGIETPAGIQNEFRYHFSLYFQEIEI